MSRKTQRIVNLSITLAVIALMLFAYFWAVHRPGEVTPEAPPPSAVQLLQRKESEVVRVEFSYDGAREYMTPFLDEMGRIQWAHSEAEGFVLDIHAARDKVRPAWLLAALDVAHEDATEVELAEFGLAPPLLTVTSFFDDGSTHTLRLGSATIDYQFYFLMIDDDPAIYLISLVLGERLLTDVADMIDLTLPLIHIEEAVYIRVTEAGKPPVVLAMRTADMPAHPLDGLIPELGGEHLVMHEPFFGLQLSTSRLIEQIIHPMTQVRLREVAEVTPQSLAVFGLDEPVLEFEFITWHGGNDVHLKFGDSFTHGGMEFIYVKVVGRPHVFIAEREHPATVMGINPLDIADRFLALIHIADVEMLTIEAGARSFTLTMNHIPDTFDIEPTINGQSVDADDFRTAYFHAISLLADADIEPFYPEGEPEVIITYHRFDSPDFQLRFYDFNANFFAVGGDSDAAMFVTNRRAVERLISFIEGLL
ncbi:MAG: DUF4340 domain-containing protein [Defluviitaleaceae bacterium]|nr:DUF4340 domain-containing protein [Defluviitaleaceae bacterium]